jgi:hypothetical protein
MQISPGIRRVERIQVVRRKYHWGCIQGVLSSTYQFQYFHKLLDGNERFKNLAIYIRTFCSYALCSNLFESYEGRFDGLGAQGSE